MSFHHVTSFIPCHLQPGTKWPVLFLSSLPPISSPLSHLLFKHVIFTFSKIGHTFHTSAPATGYFFCLKCFPNPQACFFSTFRMRLTGLKAVVTTTDEVNHLPPCPYSALGSTPVTALLGDIIVNLSSSLILPNG